MAPPPEEITVPLDEWMKIVGEKIADCAAEKAIAKHAAQCDIRHVSAAIFGNGNEGLKIRLDRMEQSRGFVRSIVVPAIVAAVVAATLAVLDLIGLRHK